MPEEILYENQGQVAVVTINRPEARNAINTGVREGLFAAWERFEKDEQARVAILTGTGNKAFCAGADLKEMAAKKLGSLPRNFLPTLSVNVHVTKPVIAAVNGVAYAGGWSLAQMCDIIVASETARFAITEAKVGRGMPWAVPLTHMIPQKVLLEILMTGDPVTAQRAYEIGFVNHVHPKGQVLTAASELAGAIGTNGPLATRGAKRIARARREPGFRAARELSDSLRHALEWSDDVDEGIAAATEGRPAKFTGR